MANANPFRFSTKYQDDETDLLYYAYRYLDSSTGRWLSRDPIEESGGRNLYAFVRNDSNDSVDAFGNRELFLPFLVVDLGRQQPHEVLGPNGQMILAAGFTQRKEWQAMGWAIKGAPCSASEWHADPTGHALVEYWWSDVDISKPHEETHVRIHKYHWDALVSELSAISQRCFCSFAKARCFGRLMGTLASLYAVKDRADQEQFDCQSYGNRFGACDRAMQYTMDFSKREWEAIDARKKCENLQ